MRGRYTAAFPLLFKISPLGPVIAFFSLPLPGLWGLGIAATIAAFELFSRVILQMPPSMALRKISRGIVSMILYPGLKATPTIWNRRHWPLVVLITMVSISMPSESWAQYNVTDSMRWDREWSAGAVGVNQSDVLEAMCNGCPLDIALKQILPPDFTPFISDDVNAKVKVDFVAGKPWGIVLSNVAQAHDLKIEVMRHNQRVIVEKAVKNQGGVSVVSLLPQRKGFYDTKQWELIPGDTLKDSFERWAKSEGWDVLYELDENIHIDVYASFNGNLIEAVQQTLEAYKAVGVLSRVTMKYSHANTVIKISLAAEGADQL